MDAPLLASLLLYPEVKPRANKKKKKKWLTVLCGLATIIASLISPVLNDLKKLYPTGKTYPHHRSWNLPLFFFFSPHSILKYDKALMESLQNYWKCN